MATHSPRALTSAARFACGLLAGVVSLVMLAAASPAPGRSIQADGVEKASATPLVTSNGTVPVVKEHRYRMSAKIRPLLLFWMGKDNVGGARVRWRQGPDGARGYDLLIGSDPRRAPREINRWGFILEEARGPESVVLGVMKKSDEDSLEAAKADVASEGKQGYFWKMIQGRADATESMATVTLTRVGKDYTYRDLDTLLDALVRFPGPPRVKKVHMPQGARAGFLTALADLVHDTVEAVGRTGRAPGRMALPYAYYGYQYDVIRTGSAIQTNATYGGKTYPRLVKASFEVRERGDSWSEPFSLVCGLDGELAEVPVFVSYQPKWWFKADMVLDEREKF